MYLDPSFGGMLIQIVVAIVAGGGAMLFALRRKVRSLFSRNKDDKSILSTNNVSDSHDDAIDVLADEDNK